MNNVTLTYTERFNETEIYGYTAVSFMEGKGLPSLLVTYHPSAMPIALLSMDDS
jgi:hypothetical protein